MSTLPPPTKRNAFQARVVADEATCARTNAHEILAAARRACVVAIDSVEVATTDEAQCVAELNAAARPHNETLAAARCAYVAAIDNVDIATADESQMRCRTQCR